MYLSCWTEAQFERKPRSVPSLAEFLYFLHDSRKGVRGGDGDGWGLWAIHQQCHRQWAVVTRDRRPWEQLDNLNGDEVWENDIVNYLSPSFVFPWSECSQPVGKCDQRRLVRWTCTCKFIPSTYPSSWNQRPLLTTCSWRWLHVKRLNEALNEEVNKIVWRKDLVLW